MRNKKLIAILVAGLFAEGTAWADDNFNWSGNLELGGRGTNIDGATRNGARGTSATTLTPFTGPEDGAKAQEYQDPSSGVIGVIDVRGSNRAYYMSLFGENLGRDDQFIYARGGGYDVFKVQFYSDRMPHNLSFNALTPLNWPGSSLQPAPAGAYPPATNPATWNNFEYGLQRNTIGGNLEVNARSPFFFRVDYNEVQTTGIRPSSGQLGTGSGNGLIEFGLPTDYTTKNSILEGGYKGKNWNVKLAFLDSKFSSNAGDTAQWGNFFMRSALDTSLQPQDSDLKKWSLNFSMRDLWLDSTVLVRLTQSELTSDFGIVADGLKPTGNQAPPTGVGYLVTAPSSSTFYGEHKTTTATFSLQSTPLPGLGTRLYYQYYDKQNDSTQVNYAAGGLGADARNCPNPGTGIQSSTATRFCITAFDAPEPFEYTKNEYGLEANYGIGRYGKLYGGINFVYTDRNLEPAPKTDDMRIWAEWRASMGDTLSGRLKYQFLQRDSELDPSYTNNASNVQPTTVPYYFRAYDVSNFDQNMVKLNVDWNPLPLFTLGFGATWRQTDYKDLYFGRTEDNSQQYDVTVTYGNPDKFLLTAHRQLGRGRVRSGVPQHRQRRRARPGRTADGDDVRLGHQQLPEELAGRGAGRLDGDRQAQADRRREAGAKPTAASTSGRAAMPAPAASTAARWSTTSPTTRGPSATRSRPNTGSTGTGAPRPATGTRSTTTKTTRCAGTPASTRTTRTWAGRTTPGTAARSPTPATPTTSSSSRPSTASTRRRPLRGWRRLRPRLRWRGPRRRRPRRHPRPLRRPRRRCRRSRWTRRCCSTSTRRC